MAKIIAPNKQYTGISASVSFVNGIGETDKIELIEWFEKHGYEVRFDEDVIPDETSIPIPLEELKKDELKELATELSIDFNSKATNDELIKLIRSKQEEDKM